MISLISLEVPNKCLTNALIMQDLEVRVRKYQ